MALFFVGKIETRNIVGNIIALASGVAFASYALSLKHHRATEQTRWQTVILGHALIALSMAVLGILHVTALTPGTDDIPKLLFLGIFQIGIAYAFFTYGIAHVRAIDATIISMIEPVLNPVWVFLGIGERPTNYAIAGGLIILAVSLFRTIRGSRESATLEPARAGE
jgi:DME family drug/metabolite transporter